MTPVLRRGLSLTPLDSLFIINIHSLASFLHSSSLNEDPVLNSSESSNLSNGKPPSSSVSSLPSFLANAGTLVDWSDQEPTRLILARKLEDTLKCRQLGESWVTFKDFRKLYGYPDGNLVGKLLIELSYSREPLWLRKARDLAMVVSVENPGLLGFEVLGKLGISFARAQMAEPASVMVRAALGRLRLLPLDVLHLIFLYLVKSEAGACLASNLLVEICGCFVVKLTKKGRLLDAMLFSLVLDGCVRFNEPIKGQAIVELMARAGVAADVHSIVVISRIHEMNGQRDDMKRLRCYVDKVSPALLCHYRPFYDSLLSLHFKFGDIDAAAELLLDLNRLQECIPSQKFRKDLEKGFLVPIGSHNLKDDLNLLIEPLVVRKEFVLQVGQKQELVTYRNGKLLPTSRALAKLILGYNKKGRTADLSKYLISIQEGFNMQMKSCLCSDVISTFISLGWLESAHDILDDAVVAGLSLRPNTYEALLTGYHEREMLKEADALVRQMKKIGLVLDCHNKSVPSSCPSQASSAVAISNLYEVLVHEMGEAHKAFPSTICELNSSIYFFCKAKMMSDATMTYRRMQEMKVQPTGQTFVYLAQGYASSGRVREITILWGDMKRNIESGCLAVGKDVYEFFLLYFIKGGYFERVMEVIGFMGERNMFVDKMMVRNEFLKLHKRLYQNLKESDVRTEVQRKRVGYIRMFREWASID